MEEFVSPLSEGERPSKRTPNKTNWKKTKDKIARHKPKAMPDYPTCSHFQGPFLCRTLTMKEVQNFHASFYKNADRNYQDNFIMRYTENRPVQRRRSRVNKTQEKPQLKRTTKYFVRGRDGGKVPVCMASFMGILNVSRFRVNRLTKTYQAEGDVTEKRGGFRKSKKYDDQKKSVMKFINTLKCAEVHYCREKSKRKYLPSELNVKKLWRMYSSKPENLPVKLSYFRMIFKTRYNVGFGMPQTDVCSTCLRLREEIKFEKDNRKKVELMTEKRVHRLQYKAFFDKLKDEDPETLLLSFDCQKNLALPKIPDQSVYYSRQFYFHNFTVVEGSSKSPLNPTNVTAYCWTENEYHKDSNLISSCVFDALQSISLSKYKRVRLISDGCGGQNKNSILVTMCHSWFSRFAPKNIEEIQLIFPVTGHSFLPPDRVFGLVEKELRTREEIINPRDIIDIISTHAKVKLVGVDCEVDDFRSAALNSLKNLKNWNFQISKCKRIHFTKSTNGQLIYTRGEMTYMTDLGKNQILTKKGVSVSKINPDIIEKRNSMTEEKKKDVEKLLCKHFGEDWKKNDILEFYKRIIENAPSVNGNQVTLCEPREEVPVLLI